MAYIPENERDNFVEPEIIGFDQVLLEEQGSQDDEDQGEESRISIGVYRESNPEDFTEGGYIDIECSCGFSGYVDAEDSGSIIFGECNECYTQFSHTLY